MANPIEISRLASFGLTVVLGFGSACGSNPANSLEVRAELRKASARLGLALVRPRGWSIAVVPFDDDAKYFQTPQGSQLMTVGNSGRGAVWIDRRGFLQPSEFIINSTTGERLGVVEHFGLHGASEFHPLALHEASRRIAFLGKLQGKESPRGLYWASFDFAHSEFISEADRCDWAPDGNAVVYENQGKIWLFEVGGGLSKLLAPGHDPTWNPNGGWIAYRAPDGRASLMSVQGVPASWPIGVHRSAGAVRWSPDGRFVSFVEPLPGIHITLLTADYRLMVCRASDNQCISAQKFGSYTGPPDFSWIVDYRKFCGTCTPDTPFN